MQALRLLEAMWEAGGDISPDTVSYNALLKACGNAAQMRVAVQARAGDLLQLSQQVMPSIVTWAVTAVCARHASGIPDDGGARRAAKYCNFWNPDHRSQRHWRCCSGQAGACS